MSFDVTKYTQSKFVKGADLDEPIVVTIARAYEHKFDQTGEVKPVLEFADFEQDLILNKTNVKAMILLFGTVVEAWVGKVIMLIPVPDAYQGKAGIRIQKVARSVAPKVAVPQAAADEEEIPF